MIALVQPKSRHSKSTFRNIFSPVILILRTSLSRKVSLVYDRMGSLLTLGFP